MSATTSISFQAAVTIGASGAPSATRDVANRQAIQKGTLGNNCTAPIAVRA